MSVDFLRCIFFCDHDGTLKEYCNFVSILSNTSSICSCPRFLMIRLKLWLYGKNTGIMCPQCILSGDTWYILLLVMSVLIIYLRWYLPGYSVVKLFLLFVISRYFGRETLNLCKYTVSSQPLSATGLTSSSGSCLQVLYMIFYCWYYISLIPSTFIN